MHSPPSTVGVPATTRTHRLKHKKSVRPALLWARNVYHHDSTCNSRALCTMRLATGVWTRAIGTTMAFVPSRTVTRGKRHHPGSRAPTDAWRAVTGDRRSQARGRTLNAAPSCVYLSLAAAGKQPCSRRQNFGFTLKPRQSIGIIREGLRQHLQRHIPIELGVSRPIYLAL